MLSHGLTAIAVVYWSVISALVRAGYVVAVPTHNDGSAACVVLDGGTELPYETEEMICTAAGHTEYADPAYRESHEAEIDATIREHRCRQLRRRVAELSCGLDYMLTNEASVGRVAGPQRCTGVVG